MLRVVLLGSPGYPGETLERWHDDVFQGAQQLGWDVPFLRAKDCDMATVLAATRDADMLVWMRTHDYNIKGDDGRTLLRRVEDQGVATVGMHFDLYWGVNHRVGRVGREPWWSAQHVFTADGGDRPWKDRRVNHHWLPPGFGTRFLGYGVPRRKLKRSAVFVGSNNASIHSPHRRQLLQWAQRQWGRGFEHFGRNAETRLYGVDLNDLYASSRLVLGDSVMAPYYWSDRLPRTLGRGGLLAYPQTPGMAEWGFDERVMILFTPGKFEEITAQLREYSPEFRKELTDNAITLVRSRHLWRHRLQHIAEVVLDGARDYRGGRASA